MQDTHVERLEGLWSQLFRGEAAAVAALLDAEGAWDDPLFDRSTGAALPDAIARMAAWYRGRAATGEARPLCTTADERRVVVEHLLVLKDGLVWDQAAQRSASADVFELAVAVVGQRSLLETGKFSAVRVYFGTWSVLEGVPRKRVGPIAPDETADTARAMDAMPVVRRYFDALGAGDPSGVELFEPDGYFREPANNYACGRTQLEAHFGHILSLGGVGIEFRTATRQGDRIGLELQTVVWGPKRMDCPQVGFACYELGAHGRLRAARVYDSVVPPEL